MEGHECSDSHCRLCHEGIDKGKDCDSAEYGKGYPRLDDLACKQVHKSGNQGKSRKLTGRTAAGVDEQLSPVQTCHRIQTLFGNEPQKSRSGNRIHASEKPGRDVVPGCHSRREGKKEEYTGCNCRVENILSKSSKGHFYHSYCEDGAYCQHPPRAGYRYIQGKKNSCDNRRKVSDRARLFKKESVDEVLDSHTGNNADSEQKQFLPAIEQAGEDDCRQQRDNHICHQPPCGKAAVKMG